MLSVIGFGVVMVAGRAMGRPLIPLLVIALTVSGCIRLAGLWLCVERKPTEDDVEREELAA